MVIEIAVYWIGKCNFRGNFSKAMGRVDGIKQLIFRYWDSGVSFLKDNQAVANSFIGILLLLMFASGMRIAKERSSYSLFSPANRSDFEDYYRASDLIRQGKDPYGVVKLRDILKNFKPDDLKNPAKIMELKKDMEGLGTYLYPPFTAYMLQPLTTLPYKSAAITFQILSISAFLSFLFVLFRYTGNVPWKFHVPVVIALVVLLRFCLENMTNGNMGFFLIFLCGLGLIFSWDRKIHIEFLGGVLLGIGAAVKITPAFFGLVLLGGRRFYAIIGVGCGVLFAFVLPALGLGWDQNIVLINNWNALILENFSRISFVRPWANNQTVSAAIGKLLVPGSDPAQADFGLPLLFGTSLPTINEIHILAKGVKIFNFIIYAFGLLVALFWAVRYESRQADRRIWTDPTIARMIMLSALISLVASGVSWYHAYCILFFPVFLRLYQHYALDEILQASERWSLYLLAVFGFFHFLFPPVVKKMLAIYSIFTWIALAMAFVLGWLVVVKSPKTS